MNIRRPSELVKPTKWARHQYSISTGMGENGTRLTGSAQHIALSRQAAQEGMVLLENNGLLPLKEGTTVALFGVGSLEYIKGGGGSGMVFPAYVRNIYEGFAEKSPRIHTYDPVSQFYYDYAAANIPTLSGKSILTEPEVPAQLLTDAAAHADVAVITIHRYSGEGWDRSAEKGDFYLTDTEEKLVADVTAHFPNSVVVLDVGGMVDTSWIRKNPKIDAALLAWQAGMEGGLAIADILCGDVNPSGKLTDTFAGSFADYPSAETFREADEYVCYYEDIYVGYRYFETIPGAAQKVIYPFGYGLSYTTFAISAPVASLNGENIEVNISVTNTGDRAGKEVVQVYFSAPQGVLGKSKVSLAAFQKTKLLAPGEKQELVLSFPVNAMASYDDLGKLQASAYVLEQGAYRILAGNSCRNLQEAAWQYIVEEPFRVTLQLERRCAPNLIHKRMLSDGSFEDLPEYPVKQYHHHTPPTNAQPPEKLMPLSAVADGKISLDSFIAQMSDDELISLCCGIPSRGLANTAGIGGIERLGIPPIMTADGPAGVRIRPVTGIVTTAWPCATLIACTWDPELMYAIGKAGGIECKENAFGVWLTPALNIHRNPLCGRNFEYFSEDPLVAGKFAAAKVQGMQSVGVAASAKHFACNNKETNRLFSDSRLSERALREIYLKAFEICVKEAQPWTIMTAYNLINGRRCCESHEQLHCILREEWGFQGMVTTDWYVPCLQEICVRAGNDVRMPIGFPDVLKESLKRNRISRGDLEACARRILGMILKLD